MANTLAELAKNQRLKYPDTATDKESTHKYFSNFYEIYLAPYRDREINLLEVGAAWGGALLCWDDWFTNANIIGVELRDHTPEGKAAMEGVPQFIWYPQVFIPEVAERPRINLYAGVDGYTPEFVDSLPDLDIVIDDGWHEVGQWEKFYELYLPKIKPGGMLIIEDISDWPLHATAGWSIQKNLIDPIKHYRHQLFDFRELTGDRHSMILAVWVD